MSINFSGTGGKLGSLYCLKTSVYGFLHAWKVFASQIQVLLSKQISLWILGKAGSRKRTQKAKRQISNIIARYKKGNKSAYNARELPCAIPSLKQSRT